MPRKKNAAKCVATTHPCRQRSVDTDRILYDAYWSRTLGNLALTDIQQGQVYALIEELGSGQRLGVLGKRLSRSSVRHVHGVLLRLFRSALSAQLVLTNPVAAIELADLLPKADRRPRAVLTDEEILRSQRRQGAPTLRGRSRHHRAARCSRTRPLQPSQSGAKGNGAAFFRISPRQRLSHKSRKPP